MVAYENDRTEVNIVDAQVNIILGVFGQIGSTTKISKYAQSVCPKRSNTHE